MKIVKISKNLIEDKLQAGATLKVKVLEGIPKGAELVKAFVEDDCLNLWFLEGEKSEQADIVVEAI